MRNLQKHVIMLAALVLALCLSVPAVAEDAWLFRLANAADPMGADEVPDDLQMLVARRVGDEGQSLNDGVNLASSGTVQLVEEAAAALKSMLDAARKNGHVLYIRQGYRDYQDEQRIYDRMQARGQASYKPGESDYQTGLAVSLVTREWRAKTLTTDFGQTAEARWLAANCARYGFILRYPKDKQEITGWAWEPWHFRYVGKVAAEAISLNHLTLEEFCAAGGLEAFAGTTAKSAPTEEPQSTAAPTAEPVPQVTSAPAVTEIPAMAAPTAEPTPAPTAEPAPQPTAVPAAIPSNMPARLIRVVNEANPMGPNDTPANLEKLVTRRNDEDGRNVNDGLYMAATGTVQLTKETADALKTMLNDAETRGYVIYIRQGYRSYEDENRVYQRMKERGEAASKPGTSEYQTGLTVMLVNRDWRAKTLTAEFGQTAEAQWLAENCARYGFILRYPEGRESVTGHAWEPWCFRYVGQAAEAIRQSGLTLDELYAQQGGADRDRNDPIILEETDERGDHEIILFYD